MGAGVVRESSLGGATLLLPGLAAIGGTDGFTAGRCTVTEAEEFALGMETDAEMFAFGVETEPDAFALEGRPEGVGGGGAVGRVRGGGRVGALSLR